MLLTGYVASWYAALQRAPASIVTSVLVVGAVVTGALQAAASGTLPRVELVGGYLLMAAAVAGLTAFSARRDRPLAAEATVGS
jgi:hypothetical protein